MSLNGNVLSWQGRLEVGESATITYSVRVNDIAGLEGDTNTLLDNVVTSPGCELPDDCRTQHPVGWYEYSKTSAPGTGSAVEVGDEVIYTVVVTQRGPAPVVGASLSDDLSNVFDNAEYQNNVIADNNDVDAEPGTASITGDTLSWSGDLAVGEVVTIRYSVVVDTVGDFEMLNVVTSTDTTRSHCVPAADGNPNCTTRHPLGHYRVMKSSDPGTDTPVGDLVTRSRTR